MIKRVTPELEQKILELSNTHNISEIKNKLGVSNTSVRKVQINHGVYKPPICKKLSEEEKNFIRENKHMRITQIMKCIKKSYKAIVDFVQENNIEVKRSSRAKPIEYANEGFFNVNEFAKNYRY